jgi:dipeptidyl aminopeptidase/acylaminoacyl peptidase
MAKIATASEPLQYPDRYRTVSPVSYVGAKTPPTVTLLGTSDHVVPTDQARSLDRALTEAGVTYETYLLPGNDHGFEVNWGQLRRPVRPREDQSVPSEARLTV